MDRNRMPTIVGIHRSSILLSLLLFAIVVVPCRAGGTPDDAPTRRVILHIGHFNSDCYPDTVLGRQVGVQFLPVRLLWGQYDSASSNSCSGTGSRSDRRRSLDETTFEYPDWSNLSGAVSFQRLNMDTLDDMMITLWGTYGAGTAARDTGTMFVIFGQKKLARTSTITLGNLQSSRATPVRAKRLELESDLTDGRVRDLSGVRSYILHKSDFDQDDTTSQGLEALSSVADAWVRVYPNPAVYSTVLEARRVPAGEYRVVVAGASGQSEIERSVLVDQSGELFRSLDLAALPSGYYVVQIYRKSVLFASYPIVLVK